MIAIFDGSQGRAGSPVPSWISRNWLITSAAFSCDIARSTRGSTTSPGRTEARPQARARIFSTTVAAMSGLDTGGDDRVRPPVLRFDPLPRQELLLESAVLREPHEVGELLEARHKLGPAFEQARRRALERPEEVGERAVRDQDRGDGDRDSADPELLQLRDRDELG